MTEVGDGSKCCKRLLSHSMTRAAIGACQTEKSVNSSLQRRVRKPNVAHLRDNWLSFVYHISFHKSYSFRAQQQPLRAVYQIVSSSCFFNEFVYLSGIKIFGT